MIEKLDYLIGELIKEDKKLNNIEIPQDLEEKKVLYRALRNIRKPKQLSEEYLKVQDAYLKEEIEKRGIIDSKTIPFDLDIISIWQGDITTLKIEAIVNACNGYLLGCFVPNHSCVDNIIHSFAGMELRDECNNIMQGKILPNGEVVLTKGYNLPSDYIIQTVGPRVSFRIKDKDREDLKNCYYNTLKLCQEKGIREVAFPCISTGLYGFDNNEASLIAIKTVKDYLKENENAFDHIIFNVFKDEDLEIYKKNLK